MKNAKERFKSFVKDENGMEILQVAIIVIIACVLAGVLWMIADKAKDKLEEAETEMDKLNHDW